MHKSTLIGSAVARRISVVSFRPRPQAVPGVEPAPRLGLSLICAVELCERLAGVMVLSLLVLYLNERLGFGTGSAAKVAGYVNVLSYLAGVLGGVLADRGLGSRRAVLGGALFLTLGYAALGFVHDTRVGLWTALAFVVAGHGLFKPNMAAILGASYPPTDSRRANAFALFYYAVNVGSMLGPCAGGLVRTSFGWSMTFHVAALCAAAACALLAIGSRVLLSRQATADFAPHAASLPAAVSTCNRPSPSNAAALGLVLVILAVFGAALSQSCGTLLLWARDDARRTLLGHTVLPDAFAALPAAFVLLFGPLLKRFTGALAKRGYTPSESGKFTAGMLLCALAYGLMWAESLQHHNPSSASPLWLVACKSALAVGELLGVPVGLALVETLALPRNKGLTLGLSYVAHALGFWLGGEVSALWPLWSHARFFGALALGCVLAAALIQSQARRFAHALAVRP